MQNRWLIPGLLMAAFTWAGAAIAQRSWEQTSAVRLSNDLRRHEWLYRDALRTGERVLSETAEALRSSDDRREHLRQQLVAADERFADLQRRLRNVKAGSPFRKRILTPILLQIKEERESLRKARELLAHRASGEVSSYGGNALQDRPATRNLLTPALQHMREQYGVARQRLWRGRPLTA